MGYPTSKSLICIIEQQYTSPLDSHHFALNVGRGPTLPIDILFGIPTPHLSRKYGTIPSFVAGTRSVMKDMLSKVRKCITSSHNRNKRNYDKSCKSVSYHVGDRVWLFVPAVCPGRTKKLASLRAGPYTIIDKTSPVNYKLQLIGGQQQKIVHVNCLKLCYGNIEQHNPPISSVNVPCTSREIIFHNDHVNAGYTSVDTRIVDASGTQTPSTTRPQRTHRPPTRYHDYILNEIERSEDASI